MMRRALIPTAALLLVNIPPAFAQSWECRDRIAFQDGWSIMEQLYFDSGPAQVGPNFHIRRGDFYANWHPSLNSLNAPFAPPPSLSFVVEAKHENRARYGIFDAPGREPLKIPVAVSNLAKRGVVAKVLFQPANATTHEVLLRQQTWRVDLVDQHGRRTGSATFVFPFNLNQLDNLHRLHVAAIAKRWTSKACEESADYDAIIGSRDTPLLALAPL